MKKIAFNWFIIFLIPFVDVIVYAQPENFEKNEINYSLPTFETIAYYDSASLDSLIATQISQNHIPGLASCIVKNNQIIWNRCYGYANIEKSLMVNDSTSFLLASVTKTFTGTAVMQLWEQGLFGLDDNVNNYLPTDVSVINPYYSGNPITFRMLLTHTSSIKYNYNNSYYPLITWGDDSPISLDSFVVNYFTPGGVYYNTSNYNNWAPGAIFEYSNEAITLLGYLTGIIYDTSIFQYCEDHIFNPLRMNHTAWFLSDLDTNNLAMPYVYQNGTYYPIGYFSHPGYPSSLLKSSSSDLARYLMAYINKGELNGVRILNSSTVSLMNTEQYPQIAPSQGLIWKLEYKAGLRVWYHGGNQYGTGAYICYSPFKKFGVIILFNRQRSLVNLDVIYDALYQYGLYYHPDAIKTNQKQISESFILSQNYPNPFNPTTTIEFSLPNAEFVNLTIYNVLGEEVATLVSEKLTAGKYKYQWDASTFASGVYLYRLEAGAFMQAQKMVLMR